MAITREFKEAVEEWKKHCEEVRFSSLASDYMNCEAYRKIVAMGPAVLPLIREIYAGPDEDAFFPIAGWACAIQDIAGDEFKMPTELRGKIEKIRDYSVKWLDENMGKYV